MVGVLDIKQWRIEPEFDENNKLVPGTGLPYHLSDLIKIAIEDGRSLDRCAYVPYAGVWHQMNDVENELTDTNEPPVSEVPKCAFCLAGAVLAGTLQIDPLVEIDPYEDNDVPYNWTQAILTLNEIRIGNYTSAIGRFMNLPVEHEAWDDIYNLPRPDYTMFDNWETFDAHLKSLEVVVEALQKHGY